MIVAAIQPADPELQVTPSEEDATTVVVEVDATGYTTATGVAVVIVAVTLSNEKTLH